MNPALPSAQRGFALLGGAILLLCLMLLGQLAVAQQAVAHSRLSDNQLRTTQARLAAQSGLNQALAKISLEPAWPASTSQTYSATLNGTGSFTVTLERLAVVSPTEQLWQLQSTGQAADGRGQVRQNLQVIKLTAGGARLVPGSWHDVN